MEAKENPNRFYFYLIIIANSASTESLLEEHRGPTIPAKSFTSCSSGIDFRLVHALLVATTAAYWTGVKRTPDTPRNKMGF